MSYAERGAGREELALATKSRHSSILLFFSSWSYLGATVHCKGPRDALPLGPMPSSAELIGVTLSVGGEKGSSMQLLISVPKDHGFQPEGRHHVPAVQDDQEFFLWFGPSRGFPKGTVGMCLIIHWYFSSVSPCSLIVLSLPKKYLFEIL